MGYGESCIEMQIAYRWLNRDLGKAEFLFSIIFISILLGMLINKSLSLFALAERHLVEATVSNIQTALNLQSAIQSITFDADDVIEITEGMNPVKLMQSTPKDYNQYLDRKLAHVRAKQASVMPMSNYLGEMYDPDIETLERGNWYFDHYGNLLIYLFKHKEYFGDAGTVTELAYSIQLEYSDIDNNELYEAGKDTLNSASLVKIDINTR